MSDVAGWEFPNTGYLCPCEPLVLGMSLRLLAGMLVDYGEAMGASTRYWENDGATSYEVTIAGLCFDVVRTKGGMDPSRAHLYSVKLAGTRVEVYSNGNGGVRPGPWVAHLTDLYARLQTERERVRSENRRRAGDACQDQNADEERWIHRHSAPIAPTAQKE